MAAEIGAVVDVHHVWQAGDGPRLRDLAFSQTRPSRKSSGSSWDVLSGVVLALLSAPDGVDGQRDEEGERWEQHIVDPAQYCRQADNPQQMASTGVKQQSAAMIVPTIPMPISLRSSGLAMDRVFRVSRINAAGVIIRSPPQAAPGERGTRRDDQRRNAAKPTEPAADRAGQPASRTPPPPQQTITAGAATAVARIPPIRSSRMGSASTRAG